MSRKRVLVSLCAVAVAGAAAVVLLATNGTEVRAQTPPAACACSRMTPIFGSDEVNAVPGQLPPRYGIVHCQCGSATCVSQISYASLGLPQLFCVK